MSNGSNESESAQASINKRLRAPKTNLSGERIIEKEPFYHGLLPREDVRMVLKENGDFMVRISEPKVGEPRSYILSVLADKSADDVTALKHLVIHTAEHKFWINKSSFPNIHELITYYMSAAGKAEEPTLNLTRPVPRQLWELEHEWITIQKKLGEGAFGEVSMGVFKFKKMGSHGVPVAVKQAKLEKMGKEQVKEFMGEARHLRSLSHPNVVKFYGVAVIQEPLYMVMELASDGALDSYLQKNPHLPLETRNEMILQAAWGLEYLHSRPILHRDIAARNCLYGDKKVKIADFGLSRGGTTYQMDPSKKVPIRWLALETLVSAFYSQKTDVWSYGIMCWEIFNSAAEPYTGMTAIEVNQKVRDGYRMQVPLGINEEIQKIIMNCWAANSNDRPNMAEIAIILQKVTGLPRPVIQEHNEGLLKFIPPVQATANRRRSSVVRRRA